MTPEVEAALRAWLTHARRVYLPSDMFDDLLAAVTALVDAERERERERLTPSCPRCTTTPMRAAEWQCPECGPEP
jgi:Zn finger protein HypA/HybF involved in hydrogenase expression